MAEGRWRSQQVQLSHPYWLANAGRSEEELRAMAMWRQGAQVRLCAPPHCGLAQEDLSARSECRRLLQPFKSYSQAAKGAPSAQYCGTRTHLSDRSFPAGGVVLQMGPTLLHPPRPGCCLRTFPRCEHSLITMCVPSSFWPLQTHFQGANVASSTATPSEGPAPSLP